MGRRAILIAAVVGLMLTSLATGVRAQLEPTGTAKRQPPVTDLAFSPDGSHLLATSQAGVQIYAWPGLQLQKTLPAAADNLHCASFSPSGQRLAIGGGDPAERGIVQVLAWPSGTVETLADEHADSVSSICWQDEQRLFSAGLDREVHQLRLGKEPPAKLQRRMLGHSRAVSSLCLLRQQRLLVSAGADQSVRVWDAETGRLVRTLSQHTQPINTLALRPGGDGLPMVATGASDRTIRFWQPTIGRMVRYARLPAVPLSVAWSADGTRLLAACTNGHLYVLDPINVRIEQNITAIAGWAYAVAVHPKTGEVIVGGSHGVIRVVPLGDSSAASR